MPRQITAGTTARSPMACSITSCRTFSTCSSPTACRLAPPALRERDTTVPCIVGEQADGLRASRIDADDVRHSGTLGASRRLRWSAELTGTWRCVAVATRLRPLYGLPRAQVNEAGRRADRVDTPDGNTLQSGIL